MSHEEFGLSDHANRANALALGSCDTCCVDVVFDADAGGRPRIVHESGCRSHREFLERIAEIEGEQP